MYQIKTYTAENCPNGGDTLARILDFCYPILGEEKRTSEIYSPEMWRKYAMENPSLLTYAETDGDVVAAVLGRAENTESVVMGFVACAKEYRHLGITQRLVELLERNAKNGGFRYITLGALPDAEGFYEKCGYRVIFEIHGQKIFQKML